MLQNKISRLKEFKAFLGDEVWSLFIRAILVGLFFFAMEYCFIYILQGFLIALGIMDNGKSFLPSWYPRTQLVASIFLVLFGIGRGIALYFKNYISGITNQAFVRSQRSKILSYALRNAGKETSHDIVAIFNEQVTYSGIVLVRVSEFIIVFTSLLLFFILALNLAWKELMIGLGLLFTVILPLKLLNKRISVAGTGLNKEWFNVSETLLLGVRNHFFLKICGQISNEIQKGKMSLNSYEKHYKDYYRISSFRNSFPLMAGVTIIGVISYISLNYIHTPPMKLVAFIYIFIRLAQGSSEANNTFGEIRLYEKAFKKIFEWNEKFNFSEDSELTTNLVKKKSELIDQPLNFEVKDVGFRYDDTKSILSNIDLNIRQGDKVLIKGESGSGKSTLISLLIGLLKPTEGYIHLNASPVDLQKEDLFPLIAYVGPEPYLIPGTVRENLLYGNSQLSMVSDDLIRLSLKTAEALEVVEKLPGKLEEELNESTQLSTGQKQRLAIARALIRGPKILILDEATANLDSDTEQRFIANLKHGLNGVTLIMISHKESFDQLATHRILLQKTGFTDQH